MRIERTVYVLACVLAMWILSPIISTVVLRVEAAEKVLPQINIGYVDTQSLYQESEMGKTIQAKIQKQVEKKNKELKALQADIARVNLKLTEKKLTVPGQDMIENELKRKNLD